MAGNKNSGRKGYRAEFEAKEAIALSWSTIIKALKDETIDLDLRLKCAIPLASKSIPSDININDVNALTHDERLSLVASLLSARLAMGEVIDVSPA